MQGLSNIERVEEQILVNAKELVINSRRLLMAEFGKQIEKFKKNERKKIIVVSKKSNPPKMLAKKISLD
jgi:hypothetical protein